MVDARRETVAFALGVCNRAPYPSGTNVVNADDLRFFLAVRQAGSIKGGARILKVNHSTVSRRLQALEEALKAGLFERTPEGLVDTDLARAIAPLAERVELLTREKRRLRQRRI